MIDEKKLEQKFHEVVRNKDIKFRQDFLNSIPLNGTLISRIIYAEGTPFHGIFLPTDNYAEMPQVSRFRQFSPFKKRKILVYPKSFTYECHKKYEDLLSCIMDHEEFHIKQWNRNSFMLWLNGVKGLISSNSEKYFRETVSRELPAFENQLKNADRRGVSPEYKIFLEKMVNEARQTYILLNEITDKKLYYELIPR
jgi:hypothetical protein